MVGGTVSHLIQIFIFKKFRSNPSTSRGNGEGNTGKKGKKKYPTNLSNHKTANTVKGSSDDFSGGRTGNPI